MDNDEDFIKLLKGDTFVFLVGEEKMKFIIHETLASRFSKTLHTMMTGKMKESLERQAELPNVTAKTFGSFVSYMYTGDYDYVCQPVQYKRDEKDTFTTYEQPDLRRIFRIMVEDGQKFHKCSICGRPCEFKWSFDFPFCTVKCRNKAEQITAEFCIKEDCGRNPNPKKAMGLLCSDHASELNLDRVKTRMKTSFPENLSGWKGFDFNCLENSTSSLQRLQQTKKSVFFPGKCLDHARVAVFADIYGVLELQKLAVTKLYWTLARLEDLKKHEQLIINLITFIYDNTPDSGGEGGDTGHVLRRMIAEFVNFNGNTLMQIDAFRAFVSAAGDVAIDMLLLAHG